MRLKVSKVTMLKWFPDCPSEFLTGKYACIKAKLFVKKTSQNIRYSKMPNHLFGIHKYRMLFGIHSTSITNGTRYSQIPNLNPELSTRYSQTDIFLVVVQWEIDTWLTDPNGQSEPTTCPFYFL